MMKPIPTSRACTLQRRCFSATARRLDNYAFIGLGQMVSKQPFFFHEDTLTDHSIKQGYQMAKNLQAKLPPSDRLSLFDINRDTVQKLAGEMQAANAAGASVALASSAPDASKDAVRCLPL